MASKGDLKNMYPEYTSDEDLLTRIKSETVDKRKVFILTKGEEGMEIYLPGVKTPIVIPAIKISTPDGEKLATVGAGGATLRGLMLALNAMGVHNEETLQRLTQQQWTVVGKTATIYAAHHLAEQNKIKMKPLLLRRVRGQLAKPPRLRRVEPDA